MTRLQTHLNNVAQTKSERTDKLTASVPIEVVQDEIREFDSGGGGVYFFSFAASRVSTRPLHTTAAESSAEGWGV